MSLARLAQLGLAGALALPAGGGCSRSETVVQLHAQDGGSTVKLSVGGKLRVSLASNITTGYSWQLVELDTAILENTGQEYVPDPAPPDIVGRGGTEHWEFTARAPGDTDLRLEYRRPWEPQDIAAAGSFQVAVTVNSDG